MKIGDTLLVGTTLYGEGLMVPEDLPYGDDNDWSVDDLPINTHFRGVLAPLRDAISPPWAHPPSP